MTHTGPTRCHAVDLSPPWSLHFSAIRAVHNRALRLTEATLGSHGCSSKMRIPIGLVASSFALALSLVSLAGCSGQVKRSDGGVGLLPVGSSAPDVQATDATGHPVRLSEMRGHPVVVYFYPKDETPGCTKEVCAFRDSWAKYEAAHVSIVGVSRDSEESHKAFREHHKLPFALAADSDGATQRAYGV